MSSNFWRQSSSLMLVSRNLKSFQSRSDFRLLMAKRSSKSKFMPNAYVFPGGVSEMSDFSPNWKEILEPVQSLSPLILKGVPRPRIITESSHDKELLERDIGFRINAIRETFEETGILLQVNNKNENVGENHLAEWRKKVHQDASQFLTMCRTLQVVPDVWSLFEWSDWLTPTKLKDMGRFDTLFYIGFLDNDLNLGKKDGLEVSHVEWTDPIELLQQNKCENIWLAPPQVYELSRLANFSKFDDLKTFAVQRSQKGCVTWMPIMVATKDGTVSIYPQDELYPEHPDYEGNGPKQLNNFQEVPIAELSARCQMKNRMAIRSLHDSQLDVNVQDVSGHLKPIQQIQQNKL